MCKTQLTLCKLLTESSFKLLKEMYFWTEKSSLTSGSDADVDLNVVSS